MNSCKKFYIESMRKEHPSFLKCSKMEDVEINKKV